MVAAMVGIVVPHDLGAVGKTPDLVVVKPEGVVEVDVGVEFVEPLAVLTVALVGEVRVEPDADADRTDVPREVQVALGVRLPRGLGVEERAVELVAGVDSGGAESPEERGAVLFLCLGGLVRLRLGVV